MGKKIVCFIQGLSGGGAEHQLTILVSFLVERGYEVTLTTFGESSDYYEYPAIVKRVRLAEGKSNIFKTLAVFWYFLFVKTDCVISYEQRNNFLCLIPLLFRKKIKVIVSERNVTYNNPGIIERILFKYLYKRANWIVPNSHTQAKYIVQSVPAYKNKVVPIVNYTDIELFKVSNLPLAKCFKIAVFARFDQQKNCLLFMEMLRKLKESTNKLFVVDWYGNQQYKSALLADYFDKVQKKLKELELEDIFRIKQPTKNVHEVLSQYDAVCLPSIYEGFSNSIAEGIASGHPMIVSNVSDNSLMVKDGVNGFLFDPHDINSMLEAFNKIFNLSDDKLRGMGLESRKIAEKLFNKEVFTDSYIKLIES